ncbi:heme peroxidase family protein [Ureibacillus sp. NPDC094379]
MAHNEQFWLKGTPYTSSNSERFGRMFPNLPSYPRDTEKEREALLELGKIGGIMDQSTKNLDNPNIDAGYTFFGQFIDHDITFDPISSFEKQNNPESIENYRTPVLELDHIYGRGPFADPHLYDISTGGIKLLVENVSSDKDSANDVPRNSQNTALVVDPRNDENMIICQLHLAFLKFHNEMVDYVMREGMKKPFEAFEKAQRLVRWHYQWIILYEYLPLLVGKTLVKDILANGRKYYKWRNKPYIPVEFSMAAFRLGHSQVRPFYKVNDQFSAPIFNASQDLSHQDPDDLRGGKRAPRRYVEWGNFFNTGTGTPQLGKRIDTTLSGPLFELPFVQAPKSLAQRNLLRGLSFGLPSGQDVSEAMRIKPLDHRDLSDISEFGFHRKTPLWFYILREAEIHAEGKRLGPVGSRIVAEVLIGLLHGDENSFIRQNPNWRPDLGKKGKFGIVDFLKFAKVV